MTNTIRFGLVIVIIALVFSLVSLKKSSKIHVTLIGIVHNSKNVESLLHICDSRNRTEADETCGEYRDAQSEEINSLCALRLEMDMSKFTNKCLRYYKLIERAKTSSENVADYLKNHSFGYLAVESSDFDVPKVFQNKARVEYLNENKKLKTFIEEHPNYENDIIICKDYQIDSKCELMNEFFKHYINAVEVQIHKSESKDVIVIMKQDQMNYVSCKDFSSSRVICKDILL